MNRRAPSDLQRALVGLAVRAYLRHLDVLLRALDGLTDLSLARLDPSDVERAAADLRGLLLLLVERAP